MFKKLRNKFMIINILSITAMMFICFSAIYIITYQNIYSQISQELNRASNSKMGVQPPKETKPERPDSPPSIPEENKNKEIGDLNHHSLFFTIELDTNKNVISKWTDLIMNSDENFFNEALQIILDNDNKSGEFFLNENYWTYTTKNYDNGSKIYVMEITPQKNILTNLIYTFILVSIAMLFFIYILCRFFAEWAIQPIKESFEKQRRFIADASHELKTPISVVNTNIDVLLTDKESTIGEQEKWLTYIKSEMSRMSNLIHNLLYLTRIDFSETETIYSDFNLSEEIENSLLSMEAVVFEKNIVLNTNIQEDIILKGNKEEIHEVFIILMDNALKYVNENGSIDVNLSKNTSEITLSVRNSGVGIESQYLNRIFDRFFRTDSSRTRETGGYGLGLSIAKAITEQHGGTIYAKSIPNSYSEFFIKF